MHTQKYWTPVNNMIGKKKRKVGEEEAVSPRKTQVNTVVRPLAQHMPFIVNSNLPTNHIVGPNSSYKGTGKRVGFKSKVGPSG